MDSDSQISGKDCQTRQQMKADLVLIIMVFKGKPDKLLPWITGKIDPASRQNNMLANPSELLFLLFGCGFFNLRKSMITAGWKMCTLVSGKNLFLVSNISRKKSSPNTILHLLKKPSFHLFHTKTFKHKLISLSFVHYVFFFHHCFSFTKLLQSVCALLQTSANITIFSFLVYI